VCSASAPRRWAASTARFDGTGDGYKHADVDRYLMRTGAPQTKATS
jgi:hypothetical protein